MNRKQLALLLFLLVVLGIGGLMVYTRQNDVTRAGDPSLGKKLLGEFPVNDVAHIALKQGAEQVNLVKKDGLWRVRERNDYAANYSQISDFLLKLRDLKIVQSETIGPSQKARLEPMRVVAASPASTRGAKWSSCGACGVAALGRA